MIIRIIFCILSITLGSIGYHNYLMVLPTPVEPQKEDPVICDLKKTLVNLKLPITKIDKIATAVYYSHKQTNIDPKLIVALMKTESNFNEKAVGPKNRTKIRYKGIMQTPTASWYPEVDILHGAKILEEKLKIANNDLELALSLYKGGDNKVARKQAQQVLNLYNQLKEQKNT